jgi:hypothetical protein
MRASGARGRGLVQLSRQGIQLHLAQPLDLVAEPCSLFEFQVRGRFAHFAFEVFDDRRKVIAGDDLFFAVLAFADADRDVVAFIDRVGDVVDAGFYALGRDAVGEVIGDLLFATPVGFGEGAFHGAGDLVGIEHDAAIDVARGAADGLDEGGFRAEETFLVGIENGDEAAFGNVEAFAEEVDADQNVERAEAKIANNFNAFDGVDVRVHIAHPNALFVHIFGEVFGHLLGEHRAEGAVALVDGLADLVDDVVHLMGGGADFDRGIDEAGGANDLFGKDAAGLLHFP